MFSGIVEELGEVVDLTVNGQSARLRVRGPLVTADARPGDSIAVNGVCLTAAIVDTAQGDFTADVMHETLYRSTIGELKPGAGVNLEQALRLGSKLGGHLVQGHIDATGQILSCLRDEHWHLLRISLPADLALSVVAKGSIGVDGVSLTVVEVGVGWFTVALIPTTLQATTLGQRAVGEHVNLETDPIAKHVLHAVEQLLPPLLSNRGQGS